MTELKFKIGKEELKAVLEEEKAPLTCEFFKKMLPIKNKIIHVRWSGEAVWIPYGDTKTGLPPENATTYPKVGEMVLYPGGVSETEMMLAYGCCHFGSKAGELAGNHFLTITEGKEKLMDIGRGILYNGAETVEIYNINVCTHSKTCPPDSEIISGFSTIL